MADFLDKLKYLDRVFYQDVVEERSGNSCCAYALCENEIKVKSTKFRISCNFNKVFEISERNKDRIITEINISYRHFVKKISYARKLLLQNNKHMNDLSSMFVRPRGLVTAN